MHNDKSDALTKTFKIYFKKKRTLALTTHTKMCDNRSVEQLGKKIKVMLLQKPSKKSLKKVHFTLNLFDASASNIV